MTRALAVLVLMAAALAGCASSDGVDGCEPPANEAAVLDDLAAEPVLALAPEGSKRHEVRRVQACHRMGDAVSVTEVSMRYDLARPLSRAEAVALYEPAIRQSGWPPETGRGGEGFMGYCKMVDGRTRVLSVNWADPAVLTIVVRLSEQAQDPCL